MLRFIPKRFTKARFGCGMVLLYGLMICALLILNGFIVSSTIQLDWGEEIRIPQAIQLVLPVVMVIAELWLFDVFVCPNTRYPT